MIENLSSYFAPEQEYYLQNITYNRLEALELASEHELSCTDNISVSLKDGGVTVVVERVLKFEPQEIFELSVSFGARLKFNEETKENINWSQVKLAEEFHINGDFVLGNLMSRISLLIAQITSSFGQQPLILPAAVAR